MSKLEQAIQQSSFKNEQHKALIGIIYLSNQISTDFQKTLKPFHITQQQYNVLRILRGQGGKPATVGLIKERMLDKMSDASRLVERLRAAELVCRGVCSEDKRSVDVTITEKGLDLLHKIDILETESKSVLKNLTDKEAAIFNELIDKMIEL